MTKEQLLEMGLTEEQAEKVLTAYKEELKGFIPKARFDEVNEAKKELEPSLRRKVKSIIDYEAENGVNAVFDVKTIKEGDTSITYNVDENTSKETIYGLSDRDKKILQCFRRIRK